MKDTVRGIADAFEKSLPNGQVMNLATGYELPYDPSQALEEQGFSKVYDCGSVSGFVK